MPPELEDDHVAAICHTLAAHHVDYVIIGGMAARLHRTGFATVDVDICPSSAEENLERLADALNELGARFRVEGTPEGVAFRAHPDLLRQMATVTLITNHGPLDLCFSPAGFTGGYQELAGQAVTVVLGRERLPVASLKDVVRSKQAAGRPKDVVALPDLEAHLRRSPGPVDGGK